MAKQDYEEAAKQHILAGEAEVTAAEVQQPTEYKSLGKVQNKKLELDNPQGYQDSLGYVDLKLENLPSQGRFYPRDTKISFRAATVKEIRHFSTMEELNPFDVDDKLNNILIGCSKVYLGTKMGSYKDILEEDRIFVILSIKEATFKQGENKLTLKAKCTKCEAENSYDLKTNNLQYYEEEDNIGRYYNEDERCYDIQTKTIGNIRMNPPSIGVMKVITDYIRDKEDKKESWDKSFMQVLPYLVKEWRGFDAKSIFNYEVDFQSWSMKKFSVVYSIAEKMKVGVKEELKHPCTSCGEEVTIPISFPGGIKALFVDKSYDNELL